MRQIDIAKAYIAANELNKQILPGYIAKKVFQLTELLRPIWTFQRQEEQKLFEKYPEFDPKLGGCVLKEDTPEERKRCEEIAKTVNNALKEIGDIEHNDLKFEPFIIGEEDQGNITISGQNIGLLKDFITFE